MSKENMVSCEHWDVFVDKVDLTVRCKECREPISENGTTPTEDAFTLLDELKRMKATGRATFMPQTIEAPRYITGHRAPVNVARTVVRKEIIPGIGVNQFDLPRKARVIHVGFGKAGQSIVHVWFEVVSTEPTVPVRLRTFATGDMIPASPHMIHIGTAQDRSMSKAWHVYQEIS